MAKIPLLEIKGLRKSFNGVEVLHSVDLTLEKGKVTALVGENGAGKSTLMKILMRMPVRSFWRGRRWCFPIPTRHCQGEYP